MVARRALCAFLVAAAVLLLPRVATPAHAAGCRFALGFATLHDLIPSIVGACVDDEQHNSTNGDALQHTIGGLLVWRKADNWTAFTDGYHSWVNGPNGLQERLNVERFPWEANPDAFPVVGNAAHFMPFWRQGTVSAFRNWTLNGVKVEGTEAAPSVQLAASAFLTCDAAAIDGGTARFDANVGLCAGVDPMAPGSYGSRSYYNGGSFYFGTLTSPVVVPNGDFDRLVASWDVTTPPGTWLQLHVRALEPDGWTGWYKLPIWASDASTIQRHSVAGQADATGRVVVDTFVTQPAGRSANAYQLSVTLFTTSPNRSPSLRLIAASVVSTNRPAPGVAADPSVWGKDLPVPQRSQMLASYHGLGFGGGGEVWCSPTSTSMVMAYWGQVRNEPALIRDVPDVAAGTYDVTYAGTGNWPFNTAYAASAGLVGYVTHLSSFSQVEQWIKVGVPIIISIAFQPGQLPGAPIERSGGHLLVVRGFTASGDPIVNDPAAATDADVRIVYPRETLQAIWLNASHGAAYVLYPTGWATPTAKALGGW